MQRRYASDEKKTPLCFIFLGSLGALLVGLGIITLFAANRKDIGRPARAVLSFIPLCHRKKRQCLQAFLIPVSPLWDGSEIKSLWYFNSKCFSRP